MHEPTHGMQQHSSTAAARNSECHFSWTMAPTGQVWINWLQDLGSLQQLEYELQVHKQKSEIKQW